MNVNTHSHSFASLPQDLLVRVFSFLEDPRDVATCLRVCRVWNQLLNHEALWMSRFLAYYPGTQSIPHPHKTWQEACRDKIRIYTSVNPITTCILKRQYLVWYAAKQCVVSDVDVNKSLSFSAPLNASPSSLDFHYPCVYAVSSGSHVWNLACRTSSERNDNSNLERMHVNAEYIVTVVDQGNGYRTFQHIRKDQARPEPFSMVVPATRLDPFLVADHEAFFLGKKQASFTYFHYVNFLTGQQSRFPNVVDSEVTALAFHASSQNLVIGYKDGRLNFRSLDVVPDHVVRTDEEITALHVYQDTLLLATPTRLALWDMQTLQPIATQTIAGGISWMQGSEDRIALLSADRQMLTVLKLFP